MIYATGDTHGNFQRFAPEHFPEQAGMTKEDYMIICGDFGGVWDTWCKFAISGCHDKVTEGTDNQFSVYTTVDDGQNKFAVAYDMKGMGPGYTFLSLIHI